MRCEQGWRCPRGSEEIQFCCQGEGEPVCYTCGGEGADVPRGPVGPHSCPRVLLAGGIAGSRRLRLQPSKLSQLDGELGWAS